MVLHCSTPRVGVSGVVQGEGGDVFDVSGATLAPPGLVVSLPSVRLWWCHTDRVPATTKDPDVRITRETVTAASRVMLPVYVVFFGWIGGAYFLGNRDTLLQTPALNYADQLLDLRVWGVLSLCVAAAVLAALVGGSRNLLAFALLFGFLCCLVWCGVFVAASILGTASPAVGAWPFLAAAACFASYRSVAREERGR